MEQKEINPYTPHLKRVLISYQSSAKDSLHGPSVILGDQDFDPSKVKVELEDDPPTPPEFKELQLPIAPPIFAARDPGSPEVMEIVLHGQVLHGFAVGGEARLCLVEVFNTVLSDYDITEINAAFCELQLHRSTSSPAQLEALKAAGVLPKHVPEVGLITKTDAERLCNALVYNNCSPSAKRVKLDYPQSAYLPFSFHVYHECFGKCEGVCTPGLYVSSNAPCIECTECHHSFSPENFVKHAHRDRERRTCHWGFDSANWRAYLLLAKDQENHEYLVSFLEEFKLQFLNDENALDLGVKQDPERYAPQKPSPSIPTADLWALSASSPPPAHSGYSLKRLEKGEESTHCLGYNKITVERSHDSPPVLQNPGKVVSRKDAEKYESHYQPNVSLAPKSAREAAPSVGSSKLLKEEAVGTPLVRGSREFMKDFRTVEALLEDSGLRDSPRSGAILSIVKSLCNQLEEAKEKERIHAGIVQNLQLENLHMQAKLKASNGFCFLPEKVNYPTAQMIPSSKLNLTRLASSGSV